MIKQRDNFFKDDFSGNQPNIHPGSIPSTGRTTANSNPASQQLINAQYTQNGVIPGLSSPLSNNLNHMFGGLSNGLVAGNVIMGGTPTSTQNVAQQQLIGGAISPSLITIQAAAVAQSGQSQQVLPVLHAATIQTGPGQHQQVSLITNPDHSSSTSGSSASSSNSSTNSGELNKAQPAAVSFIDAPMLSAMQQMFTMENQHHHNHHNNHHHHVAATATVPGANKNVYEQNATATAPIYFN